MPFFYNTEMVPDNEFGALDNETLLAEIKKRADAEAALAKEVDDSYYVRNPKTGLSPAQVEAKAAQEAAAQAKIDAENAYKAALAEQERLKKEEADRQAREKTEREAREKAEREARERAEREARERAEREARERAANSGDGFTTSLYTPSSTPTYTPPPTPPAVPPVPLSTSLIPVTPVKPPIKTAPIDTVITVEEEIPEASYDLLWENIGGQELINITRNDIVNGQTVLYQPIKNITSIQQQYNPNNIVSLQNTSDKYFANFSIKLETKLPLEGLGPDGAYVYIDDATGDLLIELINLQPDEQIEVQISLSGTIYEAEFNES